MSAADLVIAFLILAAATWLLYRSIWKKGPCHGCASSGACHPRSGDAVGLVRLGPGGTIAGGCAQPSRATQPVLERARGRARRAQ